MKQNNDLPEEEKFSEDPEENLRLQNEFLKLKMMAESAAHFGSVGNLPPEIENQFLQNVIEFEKQHAASEERKIKDILGNPTFEKEEQLDEAAFTIAYKKLGKLLKKHQIHIDFSRDRTDRFKYQFITGELFEHETNLFSIEGMITHFSYEEFYPDHELDISETAQKFLSDFLEQSLDADTYYISEEIAEPDGKIVKKEDFMKRFEAMYEATSAFINTSFEIVQTEFELQEDKDGISGMGFSEGRIQYEMIFQNGERKKIDGPFKIYFSREWETWNIFFFYLAGFNMHKK